MPDSLNSGGFTSEQIIIFKLGQIETASNNALNRIETSVKSIETDAAHAIEEAKKVTDKLDVKTEAQEKRIRSLEETRIRWLAYMAGVTGVILFLKELIMKAIGGYD